MVLRKYVKETWFAFFIFLVCASVFGWLAHQVVGEREDIFDTKVFNWLSAYSTPGIVRFMRAISFFGSHYFLFPAHTLITIVLLFKKRYMDAIVTALVPIISYVLMLALKNYFQRDRPSIIAVDVVNPFSFPSGHTFSSFVFAAVCIYLVWKSNWADHKKYLTASILLLLSLLVGLSRIVLKAHFASDVLAGLCIGMAWMVFVFWLKARLYRRFGTKE